MPDFAVTTAFKGADKISPVFNKMGKSAYRFGNRASRAFAKTSSASSKMVGMIRGFLPILSGAMLIKFGKDAIDLWKIQETAIKNVEQGLKSTNHSIGISLRQFEEMASATQEIGIFGDETILQNATAQLLTFGNIGKTNFKRVQDAALDVTAKLYGIKASAEQVRTTSIMLGKAMDNPVRGMGALRRVGISFSDEEDRQVKAMVKANNLMGAQALMLKSIERQYGGTNKALRETSAGMEIAAKNKLGDTMERIGQQLIPLKQGFYELLLQILPIVNNILPAFIILFRKLLPIVLAVVSGFIAYKIALLGTMAVQKIMIGMGWIKYLIMMRSSIFKAIKMTKLWAIAQKVLNVIMSLNPIGLIIVGIAALIAYIVIAIKNWKKFGAAMMILIGPVGKIVSLFKTLYDRWEKIKNAFTSEGILSALKQIGLAIVDAIIYPFQQLLEVLSNIPGIGEYIGKGAMALQSFREKYLGVEKEKSKIIKRRKAEELGAGMQAPNKAETMARKIDFKGRIDIAGAPRGTSVESNTIGAPAILLQLLGAQ